MKVESYEMLNPKVQRRGDVAVLTYNLVSHARTPSGEPLAVRWNSRRRRKSSGSSWRWEVQRDPGMRSATTTAISAGGSRPIPIRSPQAR